jgi:hypothetical protein
MTNVQFVSCLLFRIAPLPFEQLAHRLNNSFNSFKRGLDSRDSMACCAARHLFEFCHDFIAPLDDERKSLYCYSCRIGDEESNKLRKRLILVKD